MQLPFLIMHVVIDYVTGFPAGVLGPRPQPDRVGRRARLRRPGAADDAQDRRQQVQARCSVDGIRITDIQNVDINITDIQNVDIKIAVIKNVNIKIAIIQNVNIKITNMQNINI
jgi:hypothetical protein